jgi:hypothetical protein
MGLLFRSWYDKDESSSPMRPQFLLVLAFVVLNPTNPLAPAWSPNHEYLATTKVGQRFVTPEGGNYKLFLNGKLFYPTKVAHGLFSAYKDQHTFLSELEWSPDSRHVAFIEKIYDWEYYDPYNRYWDGWASKMRYYLAIVSTDGTAKGYRLPEAPQSLSLAWLAAGRIVYNGHTFDLATNPPQPIQ